MTLCPGCWYWNYFDFSFSIFFMKSHTDKDGKMHMEMDEVK
jgi:hypothetical protein